MFAVAVSFLVFQATTGQRDASQKDSASVRQFVQTFYDWYAPKAFRSEITPMRALQTKTGDFSPEIQRALQDYLREQQKVKDVTLGFDYDPFQDWASSYKKYSTGKIERKGDTWHVPVNAVPIKNEYVSGHVVAKVKKTAQGWCFADIVDAQSSLLGELKGMKEGLLSVEAFEGGPIRPSSAAETASVRRFAQHFYTWYSDKLAEELNTPRKGNRDPIEADVLALKTKGEMFTPELRRALLADRTAQEHSEDIVGIDSDPFVGGQDPARHYWVRKIQHRGNAWLVSVWSSYGEQSQQPDVIAKVEKTKGKYGWRFVNFLFGGDNLLDMLRGLKEDREKPEPTESTPSR